MKVRKRDIINMLSASLITAMLLTAVYAIKGIYPFGNGNLFGGDLMQLYLPNFYHIYDSFHGGSLFYDYTVAGGFDRNMLVMLFQPITWFLMLLKRSQIYHAISYLLIVKLVGVSLSASFTFSRIYKNLSAVWTVMISLFYTFSGYIIISYTNINWIEIIALYPLLIFSLLKMFEGRTKLPFVLILTYILVIQTYIAYFVVVSLIVFGGAYLFILDDKSKRKEHIYSLGSAVLMSLISSAYPLIRNMNSSFSSARFEKYGSKGTTADSKITGLLKIVFSGFNKDIIAALIILLGSGLALACLIMLAVKCLKNSEIFNATLFFAVSAFFIFIQMVCKGTDLLWHGGSRAMFPFRNGYMAAFLMCLIIGYYMSHFTAEEKADKTGIVKGVIPFVIAGAFVAAAVMYSGKFYAITENFNVVATTADQTKYYTPLCVMTVLIIFAYVALLCSKYKKVSSAVMIIGSFLLMFYNILGFMGNYESRERTEKFEQYYTDCVEVGEYYSDRDEFERIANPDMSLLTNYPYFANVSSVSNWISSLKQEQILPYKNLGYGTVYTRTLDCGATAFSRALTRTTDSVSKVPLNDSLYEETGSTESGIICYKNRYVLPFGICADDSIYDIFYHKYGNTFTYQNAIYESITGKKDLFKLLKADDDSYTAITIYDYSVNYSMPKMPRATGTVNVGKATYKVGEKSTLYFMMNGYNPRICRLYVNGKLIRFYTNAESGEREKNTFFPVGFNNNIAELGTFEKQTVELKYEILDGTASNISVYAMDNEKLSALCSYVPETQYSLKNDEIRVKAECNKDGYLFFPLSCSNNRSCTVNSKSVETVPVLGNFTAVKVKAGTNEIVMKYSKKPSVYIVLLILLSFAMSAAFVYLESFIKRKPKWLLNAAQIAFGVLVAAAVSLLYILPVGAGIIKSLISIIDKIK